MCHNRKKKMAGHQNQSSDQKSILVIDDDEAIRVLLRAVLEPEGYRVIEASDGNQGIEAFMKTPTDLVITDLIMPGKEGIETIREFRRKFPDIKIIAVSGGGRIGPDSYLKMAKGVGALRTLKKPFDRMELIDAVAEVIAMDI